MIKGISVNTPESNVEQMFIFGEEVGGSGETFTCNLLFEELTVEEQTVYNEAISIVANNHRNIIDNTTAILDINRVTSSTLLVGEVTQDFLALSTQDQDKLRSLLVLIISKKNY